MEIEIKMAGSGAIEIGNITQASVGDVTFDFDLNSAHGLRLFGEYLDALSGDFFSINTKHGPVLINKSNVLTIKKGR